VNERFPADFQTSAAETLAFLRERLGLAQWLVTRAEGDNWFILETAGTSIGLKAGDVRSWGDSLCARMVAGEGPRVALRVTTVPAYAEAPLRRELGIGAYVGVPLLRPDGTPFGSLCAIDRRAADERIAAELPLVELLAGMLGRLLHHALEAERVVRRGELESLLDPVTGLGTRESWNEVLVLEERRSKRYGNPATVVAIQASEWPPGDRGLLERRLGRRLRDLVRDNDFVARVGDGRFLALAVECDEQAAEAIIRRMRRSLTEYGFKGRIAAAPRRPPLTLEDAALAAEHAAAQPDALVS
jgi:GGDEF domain-containing protein